ncbi:MAG: hypothetical protein AB9915_03750 [Candidatus Dojkabacteria bacterium]
MAPFTEDVIKEVKEKAARVRVKEELNKGGENIQDILVGLGRMRDYQLVESFLDGNSRFLEKVLFCKYYEENEKAHRFFALIRLASPIEECKKEFPIYDISSDLEGRELEEYLNNTFDSINESEECLSERILFQQGNASFGLVRIFTSDETEYGRGVINGMRLLGGVLQG